MEVAKLVAAGIEYWPHMVFGGFAWFIARTVKGWDSAIKDTQVRVCNLEKAFNLSQKTMLAAETIMTDWALIKKGISDTEATLRHAGERLENIPVLKRDRDSAFKRIDELRTDLQTTEKSVIDRCHMLSNRVTAIAQALDSHDINVRFD